MKYSFKLSTSPSIIVTPQVANMPQPFYWNPRVTYLIRNSPDNVYNPAQQKLITQQGPPHPPEDLSTIVLQYMTVQQASPTKKQKN